MFFSKSLFIFVFKFFLKCFLIQSIFGHGRMIEPPQRGSMWRFGFDDVALPNYNDMANFCGGIHRQWDINGGKCGVCGDPYDQNPRDHEPGGKYATGITVRNYTQGQEISATIDITANHDGYFEFRLCQNDEPMKIVEQDCFDKNLLEVININNIELIPFDKARLLDANTNKFKYFVPFVNRSKFVVELKLPEKVNCKQCILQWRYHTGNNYGHAEGKAVACLGCSRRQEEFFNCADIQILPASLSNNSQNDSKSKSTVTKPRKPNPKLQNVSLADLAMSSSCPFAEQNLIFLVGALVYATLNF